MEEALFLQGFSQIAGIDEAGRGPLAGPVVAAACILPRGFSLEGLNDSKKVSPSKREELFEILTHTPGIFFGIGRSPPEEIDQINILQATFLAMQRAVALLPVVPDALLVDGNLLFPTKVFAKAVVGGDGKSFSIAAASILAKVTRDREMVDWAKQFPSFGFEKHKGYPTRSHREVLASLGPCPIHRKSFLSFQSI